MIGSDRFPRVSLIVQVAQRYFRDGMAERAPAVAYYGVLSLFPSLLLAFAVVRFVAGDSAPGDIAAYSQEHGASGAVGGALRSAVETAQSASTTTAGGAGVIGLLTLVYGASRAFTALGRAVDAIGRESRLPRSLVRRVQDIAWTLVLLAVGIVMVVLVSVSGSVLDDLLELIGIGEAVTLWRILRYPVAAALALLVVAIVRSTAPTAAQQRFTLISPGRVMTVGSLVVTTAGFNVYVTYLSSYNSTYGAFTGAIILMLWLWMAGSAFLVGAELDAVIEERDAAQPSTSPTARALATASDREEASSLR